MTPVFQKPGEVRFMAPHPRYLVQQNNRLAPVVDALAKQPKRLHPRIWNDLRTYGLRAKPFSEIPQLIGVRLPFPRA